MISYLRVLRALRGSQGFSVAWILLDDDTRLYDNLITK